MQNVADLYSNELKSITYNNEYDIRIHGIQTALSVMDYLNKGVEINSNEIIYGYFCVNTENMIMAFQKDNKIPKDGKINKETFDAIFIELLLKHELVIIQTGNKEITLYDLKAYLDNNNENDNENDSDNGDTDDNSLDSLDGLGDLSLDEYDNDLALGQSSILEKIQKDNRDSGLSLYYEYLDYINNGGTSLGTGGSNGLDGGKTFDEIIYKNIMAGKSFDIPKYNYNMDGKTSYKDNGKYVRPTGSNGKDYNYIYSLLANSIYDVDLPERLRESKSNLHDKFKGSYTPSNNFPYFNSSNIETLKKQQFDIEIHYGQKGETAKKIIAVSPISVTQEVDASGNPVFDVYEFVARDLVDSK